MQRCALSSRPTVGRLLNIQKHFSVTSTKCLSSSTSMSQASNGNSIHSHEISINGGKIHYERAGTGPHNLLLLPGALGSTRTDFLPQMSNIDPNKFTIYAWDPPGYGKSRPPNRTWPDKFFSRDAADAASLIKDLNLDKVSLVGWSDGGITALVMAVFYPEIINKLVLWGCNAHITQHDVSLLEAIRDLDKWSERMRKPFEELYGQEYFKSQWNQWIDAYSRYFNEHQGNIVKDRIHEIKKPTLIVHGQKDALVPQEHPDFLHAQIEGSQLVNWPDAKHNLHLRYADEFNQLITDFLVKE